MIVVANPEPRQSEPFQLAQLGTHPMWAPRSCNGTGFDRSRIESTQKEQESNPLSGDAIGDT